jgi:FMN-dependent NADH-azoreductase
MKVLHIDAGITGPDSLTRELSAAVVEALVRAHADIAIARRDLDAQPIPRYGGRSPAGPQGNELLEEFLAAEVLVIGAPKYNFGVSTQLKAWIDHIMVEGKTFRYGASGAEGLAGGKSVILASGRGGARPRTPTAAIDFNEPYLKSFFRFLGVEELAVIRAEGGEVELGKDSKGLSEILEAVPAIIAELLSRRAA